MKILYAIQGTGNGHISRARDIIPHLREYGEVDILISGLQADVKLQWPVKYSFKGMGFIFGKQGGVDLLKTFLKAKTKRFYREMRSLPVENYDLVINDFEPVSAWACYFQRKPCISLSHQAAVLDPNAPAPDHYDPFGKFILKNYAPTTVQYGFHFERYSSHIFTPVIRKQIRDLNPVNRGHITVYLPSYDDERLIKNLSKLPNVQWQVFSKHNQKPMIEKNISLQPIGNEAFIKSMASSAGVLCGAGFETPAEAMYMGKKLIVIPMKSQYEQHCNAAALKHLGVPVMKSLKKKHLHVLENWILHGQPISINFPDNTAEIVRMLVENHFALA